MRNLSFEVPIQLFFFRFLLSIFFTVCPKIIDLDTNGTNEISSERKKSRGGT